jgi:glycosyltransferase involved in cell wall biosynthesis
MKTSDLLICVACFNSEDTIIDVVESLLRNTDADILLIDDLSDEPVEAVITRHFSQLPKRLEIHRPKGKVYCGGAKNVGIRHAIREAYHAILLIDCDVIVPEGLDSAIRRFFRESPTAVVVAPAILPAGTPWQYTDTLINFSKFLPDGREDVSERSGLAGYAFAINLPVFAQRPCFHETRFGGEDVLFFHQLAKQFGLRGFPVLNSVPVVHLPPRGRRQDAQSAQKRYGAAFFTHVNRPRERVFRELPWLHFLTPRWWLMLSRVIRRRRWPDLRYAAHAWLLDMTRARHIMHLQSKGYCDPMALPSSPGRCEVARDAVDWSETGQVESLSS